MVWYAFTRLTYQPNDKDLPGSFDIQAADSVLIDWISVLLQQLHSTER